MSAIHPSFYLQDLDEIRNNIPQKIENFLEPKEIERIEIDKDIANLKGILSPEAFPFGKWPSKYHPAMMQQVTINLTTIEATPVFSVNGHPVSGKTTLVKELVADKIVKRAIRLANFKNADDAFEKEEIENNNNKYFRKYYKMHDALKGFSMLVASNNNAAVENISLDLPNAKDVVKEKTLSGLFDKRENEDIYFTDTANSLFNFDAWGLISVPLGKKENNDAFLKSI